MRPRTARCACAALALVLGAGAFAFPAAGDPHDWFAGIVRRERDSTAAHAAAVRDTSGSPDSIAVPPPATDSLSDLWDLGPEPWGSEYRMRARFRRHGERDLWVISDYNRVDQLRLGLGLSPLPPEPFYPRAELSTSYSLGRGFWNYHIAVEQPFAQGPYLAVGGRLYRMTDSPDWGLLSRVENTLSALLVRQDYLDYFGRRGVTGYGRAEWGEGSSFEVDYHVDELASVRARPETWSLFGGSRAFRPNPGVPEGTLHQLEGILQFSTRRSLPAPRLGMDLRVSLEGAGKGLGGDFDFSRLRAEYRWTFKLAPGLWLNQRAAFGTAPGGTLPQEYQFYAGGVGTLRGYEYKQFTGDRFYLYNVEYAVNLGQHIAHFDRDEMLRGLELVLFGELGKAWNQGAQGGAGSAHPAWDVGAGVQTSGDGFHLYLAQNLQTPRAGPKLTFRLSRTY